MRRIDISERQDPEHGLDQQTIRRWLGDRSAKELASFLLKGMRENKAFRRKVLAWLIDTDGDQLPADDARTEIRQWIEDVFEQRSYVTPRDPDLRALSVVRTAVRHHPELAVFAHTAVVDEIASLLHAYGGGPDALYSTMVRHFEWAAEALALIKDEDLRLRYLEQMEDFVAGAGDFGYGIDSITASALEAVADRFPDRAFDYVSIADRAQERRQQRRRRR